MHHADCKFIPIVARKDKKRKTEQKIAQKTLYKILKKLKVT